MGGYDLTARYVADVAEWAEAGVSAPAFIELKSSDKSARQFSEAITSARESQGKLGASVFVYPEEDYRDMRLFLTEDGKSGFALKDTGEAGITDIVSVFNTAGSPHCTTHCANHCMPVKTVSETDSEPLQFAWTATCKAALSVSPVPAKSV